MTLIVNEIFGPTFQGEGPNVGKICSFVRLTGCNLHCYWCDTPYTWRFSARFPHRDNQVFIGRDESHRMEVPEIIEKLRDHLTTRVVISGGEPILQRDNLGPLIRSMTRLGWEVEVETAGTIHPDPELTMDSWVYQTHYNVSPKLSNSCNPRPLRYQPEVLKWFAKVPNSYFKFVVKSEMDFREIDEMVSEIGIPEDRIYIMPEGVDRASIEGRLQSFADEVLVRGWNLSSRLQIILWGNRRGV